MCNFKLMNRALAGLILAGCAIGMAGCTEESGVTSKTEITGPGGKTTVTDKTTIDKSGKNPPAALGETHAP